MNRMLMLLNQTHATIWQLLGKKCSCNRQDICVSIRQTKEWVATISTLNEMTNGCIRLMEFDVSASSYIRTVH